MLILRLFRALLNTLHRFQVVVNGLAPLCKLGLRLLQVLEIVLDLDPQLRPRLFSEMDMMAPLHTALDLRGDQQADSNREEVKEELPNPMNRLVGQMNFEHWRTNLLSEIPQAGCARQHASKSLYYAGPRVGNVAIPAPARAARL